MKEFYPGNSFYGHGNIIRKYARFPHWLPLPVCIQHGWMLKPMLHDARTDAAENWYWSSGLAERYKKEYPYINFRIVGAPFIYCLKNINYQHCNNAARNGSIVFPFHSTENIFLNSDVDKYCYLLNRLPDSYKPITICIYHNDKKKGIGNLFSNNGFKVVCNGDDPCDDNFLYSFVKNVQGKKYLISNEWSTAMHYGAILGCQINLYGPKVKILKSEDENFSEKFRDAFLGFNKDNRKYFTIENSDKKNQHTIAAKELGYQYVLSKMKMLFLLWRLVFTPQYFNKFSIVSG